MTGERIGIAGLGLIGGSIALRARARGARVTGFDRDTAATARALERGAIERSEPSLEALATSCDTLVIALPLGATVEALERLGSRPDLGAGLVIDVASVKGPLARFGVSLVRYIGTHPMAGRERGGIGAADPELFENATWAHVPHRDPVLTARVRAFIGEMGARPLEIDAAEHDAIVASTSHLPQAISIVLAAELAGHIHADPRVIELCGPGMMSMLRLARSPAPLWSAIFSANAVPLASRLRSVASELVTAADGLDRGDSTPLMSYFEGARDAVDALAERFPTQSRS